MPTDMIMPFIILFSSIVLLLLLIVGLKLNSFIALLIASAFVGIGEGIPLLNIFSAMQKGIGSTLGSLAIIISFGAMLGKLLTESGGAQRISTTMIDIMGKKNAHIAVCITSFIIAITLFFEVAFVLLIPIIFTLARSQKIPLLKIGIPMASAVGIAHAFLPPHPGATAVTIILGADLGRTLLYGIIVAIPTLICAGIYSYKFFMKDMSISIPENAFSTNKIFEENEMPSFFASVATALTPVFLIAAASIAKTFAPETSFISECIRFIGNPDMALFIALCVAVYVFGLKQGKTIKEVMSSCEASITSIALIMLIIGAGGAFKQVIIDSGLGDKLALYLMGLPLSTYVLTFIIGAIIRIAVGSATVTSLTTAGLVAPMVVATGMSPEITTLIIGASSMIFGPPHDAGFWIFKEFFGLNMNQAFRSWCVMCTIIGVVGFASTMILNLIVN